MMEQQKFNNLEEIEGKWRNQACDIPDGELGNAVALLVWQIFQDVKEFQGKGYKELLEKYYKSEIGIITDYSTNLVSERAALHNLDLQCEELSQKYTGSSFKKDLNEK